MRSSFSVASRACGRRPGSPLRVAVLSLAAALAAGALAGWAPDAGAEPTSRQRRAFVLRNTGIARVESQQNKEAKALFEELTRLFPEEALGHANLALCELRLGDPARATAAIRRARALAPGRADIALLEVNVLQAGGDLAAALRTADAALGDHPDDPKLIYVRAEILEATRDRERRGDLLATWMRLHRAAPTNVFPILEGLALGSQLEAWEEVREFAAAFDAAWNAPPDRVAKALETVRAAASGDATQARRAFTQALVVRNVLRATTRFRRDAERLRLPSSLGGGEEIVEFASDELRAVREALDRDNPVTWRAAAPLPLGEGAVAAAGLPPILADFSRSGRLDAVAWGMEEFPVPRRADGIAADEAAFVAQSALPVPVPYEVVWSAAVDWDNDEALDVVAITRPVDGAAAGAAAGAFWVLRNVGGSLMPPLAAAATLSARPATAAAGDLDHDGDLDVVVWVEAEGGGWEPRLVVNRGDGSAEERAMNVAPIASRPLAAVVADLDDDVALDVAVATDAGFVVLLNNLDGTMRLIPGGGDRLAPGEPTGGPAIAVADFSHDGAFDLAIAGRPARVLPRPHAAAGDVLPLGPADELVAADVDNDGWTDLLLRDGDTWSLRRNRGGAWTQEALAAASAATLRHAVAADLDADGDLDVVGLTADGRSLVRLLNDGGNANRWIALALRGRTQNDQKNNYFGLGSVAEVLAGEMAVRQPVVGAVTHFGLGQRAKPDILRIVWTNGTPQSIFDPATNQRLDAEQVIIGSCPSLYCWDGEKFVFVTDVLWRSALGMYIMQDVYGHHETSNDWFRLTQEQVGVRDGWWELRFVMDLWETAYVDEVRLLVVDHPDDGGAIYVNEATLPPPFPAFELVRVAGPVGLAEATDERGVDHRAALARRDKRYADTVRPTAWQGLAETTTLTLVPEHWPATADEPFRLVLDGWIYPTDASINVALAQHPSLVPQPPLVEARGADGAWVEVARPGFPSGKFKTVIVDLGGRLPAGCDALRLTTNFQLHWDAIFFAIGEGGVAGARTTTLHPARAELSWRGTHRMEWENGVGPFVFDYDDVVEAPRWLGQAGRFTRWGDVTAMLAARDDRYVVTGSGEQISLFFDPAAAPALPEGWRRDFVLFTDGWLKDANLNSLTGQTVEPYPFTGMSAFPPPPGERPSDPGFAAFLEETVTRERPHEARRAWEAPPLN